MGRDLQKKKRRSSRQPVRQSQKPRKALNPRGNDIVAKNWNKNETLAQNYKRLGLVSRLRAPAGGTEKKIHDPSLTLPGRRGSRKDPLAMMGIEQQVVSEAKVERDADGKIVRIIRGVSAAANPLNDPLNGFDSDEDMEGDGQGDEWGGIEDGEDGEDTEVVRELLEASRNTAEKKPRYQSEQEKEWLEKLVAKHGDDTRAMARDLKLNPMQQTAADISKRIKKMKQ